MKIILIGVLATIHAHVPNLQIRFVDTEIMNQLSYGMAADKIADRGFTPKGDLIQSIEATIKLLRQAGGIVE